MTWSGSICLPVMQAGAILRNLQLLWSTRTQKSPNIQVCTASCALHWTLKLACTKALLVAGRKAEIKLTCSSRLSEATGISTFRRITSALKDVLDQPRLGIDECKQITTRVLCSISQTCMSLPATLDMSLKETGSLKGTG